MNFFPFSRSVSLFFFNQVLSATAMPGLFDKLVDSNELLDQINKGLNAYLEKKRLFFPRYVPHVISLSMRKYKGG